MPTSILKLSQVTKNGRNACVRRNLVKKRMIWLSVTARTVMALKLWASVWRRDLNTLAGLGIG